MKLTAKVFLLLLFIGGCKAIPSVQSVPFQREKAVQFRYYDSDSKIRYAVSHDAENLYLQLNTTDRFSIRKIMRTGLSIYFDQSGKKKTEISLQYPMPATIKASTGEANQRGGGARKAPNLQDQIDGLPKTAVFRTLEQTEAFQVSMESDIQVAITALNNQELSYRLKVPFSRIPSTLNTCYIGIISGKFSGSPNQGMQRPTRAQGGRPRGGRGGRPGGGGQGMGQGGRTQAQNLAALTTPIEFWINVEGWSK
ncbi:MAG: hypothetical protein ACFB10_19380 [Salibacteraceae bacterium]|mgnify:CR=1 FL=1